jgi:hypothetical protein
LDCVAIIFCPVFVHFLFSDFWYSVRLPSLIFLSIFLPHKILMHTSINMLQNDESREGATVVSGTEGNSYQEISSIKERWLSLKSREIISELTQIRVFSESLEKLGYRARGMAEGVNSLIVRLRSDRKDSRYVRIVEIITKYLNGIHNFMSNRQIRGILSYKALFESTMIAIRYEIDCLDV